MATKDPNRSPSTAAFAEDSSAAEERLVETILQSAAAAAWLARLTETFFDREAKRQVIGAIREGVTARVADRGEAVAEAIRQAVVRRLVGLASQTARVPEPETLPSAPLVTGADLEDLVIDRYPAPVAAPYYRLTRQGSAAAGFGCLLDTFEGLIHYLATVAVSAYLRGGLTNAACNRHLLERFVKGTWGTGDLFALLRDTVRLAGDCGGRLPYPELPAYLFTPQGKPTASGQVLESFVSLRNEVWGHGTGRAEDLYARILPENRTRLEQELARLRWLETWELIRPVVLDETGRVTVADRLMGERRRKGRSYDLPLAAADLDHQGGDVRPEKTLLLVAPDRRRYLPLFPLSLFHFQLRSEGVYFLQRLQWQHQPERRLRRSWYVAYDAGMERHEEQPGDLAVRSLEQHVRRLETAAGPLGVPPSDSGTEAPAADPDCELPEVRHEQEFHLRTFAGRESLLQRLAGWIDARGEGGYLLLLGPPGQGKSALMAELARREQERGGCLLHMVKSHRNPLKFVPALLSQAARLAQTPFGPAAYRGDVDDLRNALVRALEAVRKRTGRAVLVLDALDELDPGGERVGFLPEVLPAGVRAVLTCRPDIPLVQLLQARLQGLEEWEVPPLSREDLPLVLARRFDAPAVRTLEGALDWHALFDRLQGNPLFLHRALDRIARALRDAQAAQAPLRVAVEALPASLDALFQDIYNEIAEKQGTRHTSAEGRHKARLLQLLCLAREPLALDQWGELLTTDGTVLTWEDCRDRAFEMSQYLLDAGEGRFKPWHQGLADYVRQHVLGPVGCRRVEEVFCTWLARPGGRAGMYGLRHQVRHLLGAQQFDALADRLTDLRYLEARVEAGLVFDLINDFTDALRHLPLAYPRRALLGLLQRALRTDVHFLARHPTTLFQCLWNRCWWYDCPAAAHHYLPPEGGWPPEGPPWERPGPKLHALLEAWQAAKERITPGFLWFRSLRPPPVPLSSAQRAVFHGHYGEVNSLAYSPDGRWLASGGEDETVRIWDAENSQEVACCRGHAGAVRCVAFAPDGRWLASGGEDETVRVWDVEADQEVACLRGHAAWLRGLAFAPDGRRLLSAAKDGSVSVWDVRRGLRVAGFGGPEEWLCSVAFAADGCRLVCANSDGTLRIRDAETGRELICLVDHQDCIRGLAFSPDGRWLASGARDGMVRIWDLETGRERISLRGHGAPVGCVAFAPDGRRIVSAGRDLTVRVWDAESGRELARLSGPDSAVWHVTFSPDGQRVACGARDGTIRVWDAEGPHQPTRLCGHGGWVRGIDFAPDGRHVLSVADDSTLRLWETATGRELTSLRTSPYGDVAYQHFLRMSWWCWALSPDGRRLAFLVSSAILRLWDVFSGQVVSLRGHDDWILGVAFSPDSRLLATGSGDRTVRVWDAQTGACLGCLHGHEELVHGVAFSPDGKHVLSWDLRMKARVWDVATGTCLEIREVEPSSTARRVSPFPYLVLRGENETVLKAAATEEPVAWFPTELWHLVHHPARHIVAGAHANHLYLIVLEGTALSGSTADRGTAPPPLSLNIAVTSPSSPPRPTSPASRAPSTPSSAGSPP